jgi:hypothetical protein
MDRIQKQSGYDDASLASKIVRKYKEKAAKVDPK